MPLLYLYAIIHTVRARGNRLPKMAWFPVHVEFEVWVWLTMETMAKDLILSSLHQSGVR